MLELHGRITSDVARATEAFIKANQARGCACTRLAHRCRCPPRRPRPRSSTRFAQAFPDGTHSHAQRATYGARAAAARSGLARDLFALMERKRSNLCVAADVTTLAELEAVAAAVGPHIVCLKTHCDMIADWDATAAARLRALADKHDFIVFEDRKFADIGSTVAAQLSGGVHRISSWADCVTAHALPGPGIVAGLATAVRAEGVQCRCVGVWCGSADRRRGVLLLAHMSSQGNLVTPQYTAEVVKMAEGAPDAVLGEHSKCTAVE